MTDHGAAPRVEWAVFARPANAVAYAATRDGATIWGSGMCGGPLRLVTVLPKWGFGGAFK
jgi:hypothetical protein